ncbi:hypothetical protein BV133_601 [Blastochloris viridis]|uniref:Uncharacterized protein n=1 Tax=Blastochloris viridis TaxID=1079 RepID=A0A182CYI2_BLAVI|nr:hypothetical protein BV133_601 [Blastochloris viridis]
MMLVIIINIANPFKNDCEIGPESINGFAITRIIEKHSINSKTDADCLNPNFVLLNTGIFAISSYLLSSIYKFEADASVIVTIIPIKLINS